MDIDADNDGLTNGLENTASCPYVLRPDSDGDGVLDGPEYYNGNSECNAGDFNLRPADITPPSDCDSRAGGRSDAVNSLSRNLKDETMKKLVVTVLLGVLSSIAIANDCGECKNCL